MSEIGQNNLKFGHKMHYRDSNQFPKFCQKTDFFAKTLCFFKLYGWFPFLSFQRKNSLVPGKWYIWPNFSYKCALGYPHKYIVWIFCVLVILWSPICAKMAFLLNFYSILTKKSPIGTRWVQIGTTHVKKRYAHHKVLGYGRCI